MRRYRKQISENEEFSFWQSYSDMMAALLLLFVLIMSSSLLLYRNSYEERLKEKEMANAELQQQAQALREQELLLQNQQDEIDAQKLLLENQQEQLDKLIGIKEEIIESLSQKLEQTNLSVAVDPTTGSIAFDSSILFDSGSYEMAEEGTSFLEEFIPVYFSALLDSEYESYISEIIIEGHTDTDGTYMYNLDLSQKRALAVSQYCLQNAGSFLNQNVDMEKFQKILTANGRSFSNPVLNADGSINKEASRRVEFKFRLQDEEMISQMKGILEHEK